MADTRIRLNPHIDDREGCLLAATGRKPSVRYREVADLLRPHGLTPGQYVRELLAEGLSYPKIGRVLAQDIGGKPPYVETLQFWESVENKIGGEWVGTSRG